MNEAEDREAGSRPAGRGTARRLLQWAVPVVAVSIAVAIAAVLLAGPSGGPARSFESALARSEATSRVSSAVTTEVALLAVASPKVIASETTTAKTEKKPTVRPAHKTLVVAFFNGANEDAYVSLERNIDEIDVLMPLWYHIGSDGLITLGAPEGKERVMNIVRARKPGLRIMPIVNNYDKAKEAWNPAEVSATHASA